MNDPQNIALPGEVALGLAADSVAGPIYVTSHVGNPDSGSPQTALSAVDLSGAVLWQRFFDGPTGVPRATGARTVWLARNGPDGAALEETGPDGSVVRAIPVAHRPGEELSAVVVLPDGFCTAWTSGPVYQGARVDRRDPDGACIWSAPIPPGPLAHHCVMTASAETGWQQRPRNPWIPSRFQLHHWEPLLVSGDRILASYRENKSGLGISYFLDAGTGQILNATKPAPIGRKALSGDGEFLIGVQGYDEFATVRYDRDCGEAARWPSHGAMLIDRLGTLLGVELDNRSAAQPSLRVMERDGSLSCGPALPGYHTTHPALDRDGTAVFCRDGSLLTVDAELTRHELGRMKDDRIMAMSRILLLEDGIVAFTVNDELFIFRTSLGPLEDSVWPCGDGNLNGNPVI